MGVKASRWRDKRRARDKRDEIELLMLIERGKTIYSQRRWKERKEWGKGEGVGWDNEDRTSSHRHSEHETRWPSWLNSIAEFPTADVCPAHI